MARPKRQISSDQSTATNGILAQLPTIQWLEDRAQELTDELNRVKSLLSWREALEDNAACVGSQFNPPEDQDA
jgi:hypothetical protein